MNAGLSLSLAHRRLLTGELLLCPPPKDAPLPRPERAPSLNDAIKLLADAPLGTGQDAKSHAQSTTSASTVSAPSSGMAGGALNHAAAAAAQPPPPARPDDSSADGEVSPVRLTRRQLPGMREGEAAERRASLSSLSIRSGRCLSFGFPTGNKWVRPKPPDPAVTSTQRSECATSEQQNEHPRPQNLNAAPSTGARPRRPLPQPAKPKEQPTSIRPFPRSAKDVLSRLGNPSPAQHLKAAPATASRGPTRPDWDDKGAAAGPYPSVIQTTRAAPTPSDSASVSTLAGGSPPRTTCPSIPHSQTMPERLRMHPRVGSPELCPKTKTPAGANLLLSPTRRRVLPLRERLRSLQNERAGASKASHPEPRDVSPPLAQSQPSTGSGPSASENIQSSKRRPKSIESQIAAASTVSKLPASVSPTGSQASEYSSKSTQIPSPVMTMAHAPTQPAPLGLSSSPEAALSASSSSISPRQKPVKPAPSALNKFGGPSKSPASMVTAKTSSPMTAKSSALRAPASILPSPPVRPDLTGTDQQPRAKPRSSLQKLTPGSVSAQIRKLQDGQKSGQPCKNSSPTSTRFTTPASSATSSPPPKRRSLGREAPKQGSLGLPQSARPDIVRTDTPDNNSKSFMGKTLYNSPASDLPTTSTKPLTKESDTPRRPSAQSSPSSDWKTTKESPSSPAKTPDSSPGNKSVHLNSDTPYSASMSTARQRTISAAPTLSTVSGSSSHPPKVHRPAADPSSPFGVRLRPLPPKPAAAPKTAPPHVQPSSQLDLNVKDDRQPTQEEIIEQQNEDGDTTLVRITRASAFADLSKNKIHGGSSKSDTASPRSKFGVSLRSTPAAQAKQATQVNHAHQASHASQNSLNKRNGPSSRATRTSQNEQNNGNDQATQATQINQISPVDQAKEVYQTPQADPSTRANGLSSTLGGTQAPRKRPCTLAESVTGAEWLRTASSSLSAVSGVTAASPCLSKSRPGSSATAGVLEFRTPLEDPVPSSPRRFSSQSPDRTPLSTGADKHGCYYSPASAFSDKSPTSSPTRPSPTAASPTGRPPFKASVDPSSPSSNVTARSSASSNVTARSSASSNATARSSPGSNPVWVPDHQSRPTAAAPSHQLTGPHRPPLSVGGSSSGPPSTCSPATPAEDIDRDHHDRLCPTAAGPGAGLPFASGPASESGPGPGPVLGGKRTDAPPSLSSSASAPLDLAAEALADVEAAMGSLRAALTAAGASVHG